ncbi:MAG: TRAP transporter small permease [Clostridia bacterium]|jgi:TRAP-type C4-dicarboxylate transport system permease small subunit
MLKFYRGFCKVEEVITSVAFVSIIALIFSAAIFRAFSHPLVWADDIARFLFSWTAFLGADIALRHSRLVGVDMLVNKLPPKARKLTEIIVYSIMLVILVSFVYYGTQLSIKNWDRDFQTLSFMSYSMVTLSLPVASFLMMISASTKLGRVIINFRNDSYEVKQDIPMTPAEAQVETMKFE